MANLPEAFIFDRDQRMFEARKRGANYREIARMFKVSPSTAHAGVQRVMTQISKQMAVEHRDVYVMELERLDDLLKSVAPMTVKQKITIDGQTVEIPPSLDAIKEARAIIAQRAKMLGLEKEVIESRSTHEFVAPKLTVETDKPDTPEQLAKDLAMEMIDAGVISGEEAAMLRQLLNEQKQKEEDIEDAVVVSDSDETPAIGPGMVLEAPEWVDPEEEPPEWIPDPNSPPEDL